MTGPCIWCLGKRSLEHSPTQQGEFWALQQDSPVLTHTSLQYVLIHTRWHPPGFHNPSSGFQSKHALNSDTQTFSRTRSRAPVTVTSQTQGHKIPLRQLAQLEHPLVQLPQLLSSMPATPSSTPSSVCSTLMKILPAHKLKGMLWWGKNLDVLWHHSQGQCHGTNLMTRHFITFAGSTYNHFSPFHRWGVAWGQLLPRVFGKSCQQPSWEVYRRFLVFPALAGCCDNS